MQWGRGGDGFLVQCHFWLAGFYRSLFPEAKSHLLSTINLSDISKKPIIRYFFEFCIFVWCALAFNIWRIAFRHCRQSVIRLPFRNNNASPFKCFCIILQPEIRGKNRAFFIRKASCFFFAGGRACWSQHLTDSN